MENFVVGSEQDSTLDVTKDNQPLNIGIHGTNAGDVAAGVTDRADKSRVSGHVIFNQVGNCLNRKNGRITGSNCQKYWVQSLCSTTPGESSPLVQPEAMLFPRHFYASAQADPKSILGARPLFLLSPKKHPYGFDSALQHAQIRMTDPSSSTSTVPNLMCCMFDELGNMALNSNHSRDMFQTGFVVDNKSSSGLAVQEKGHTNFHAESKRASWIGSFSRVEDFHGVDEVPSRIRQNDLI